jgi:chromosome partitioning protein
MKLEKIIAVVNDKGGVGKTLLAVNIAYILARRFGKTMLLDFDGQSNSSIFYREDFQDLIGAESIFTRDPTINAVQAMVGDNEVEGLFIATATKRLSENAAQAAAANYPLLDYLLRTALRNYEGDFKFAAIDCPPSPNNLAKNNAIAIASDIIVPVIADISSFQGVVGVVERIALVNNEEPTVHIVTNAYQQTHKSMNRRVKGWMDDLEESLQLMLNSNKNSNPVNVVFHRDIKIPTATAATEAHSLYYPLDVAVRGSHTNYMIHRLVERVLGNA